MKKMDFAVVKKQYGEFTVGIEMEKLTEGYAISFSMFKGNTMLVDGIDGMEVKDFTEWRDRLDNKVSTDLTPEELKGVAYLLKEVKALFEE